MQWSSKKYFHRPWSTNGSQPIVVLSTSGGQGFTWDFRVPAFRSGPNGKRQRASCPLFQGPGSVFPAWFTKVAMWVAARLTCFRARARAQRSGTRNRDRREADYEYDYEHDFKRE